MWTLIVGGGGGWFNSFAITNLRGIDVLWLLILLLFMTLFKFDKITIIINFRETVCMLIMHSLYLKDNHYLCSRLLVLSMWHVTCINIVNIGTYSALPGKFVQVAIGKTQTFEFYLVKHYNSHNIVP